MDIFESTGTLFITPGGQNEHPESWGPVIRWGALNIGAESWMDPNWQRQRQLMANAGVTAFPWVHVRSMSVLESLITKAEAWGVPIAGVNVEDVVSDELSVPAIAARLQAWGGQALIITLPWLPNGQGWQALDDYPFALEYFPYDPAWDHRFDNRAVLVEHACQEIGAQAKISFLYGTYPSGVARPDGAPPYDLTVAHSFYTGDAVGTTVQQWNVWRHDGATPYVRCHGDNGGVTPIGYQDGITAAVNRLRDKDPGGTLLKKNAQGKWPGIETLSQPVDQWKAYDKLERTLAILKEDHDAAL